jgi:hypothetical protein
MAEVKDVDEDLRHLARLVPVLTRLDLSPADLQLRCEVVAELIGEADLTGQESKRREAWRYLQADSLRQVKARLDQYDEQARAALADGNDQLAAQLTAEATAYAERYPVIPEEREMADLVARLHRAANTRPAPWWARLFSRRK